MDATTCTPPRFFNVTARLSDGPGKDAAFREWTYFRGRRWALVAPRHAGSTLNVSVRGAVAS